MSHIKYCNILHFAAVSVCTVQKVYKGDTLLLGQDDQGLICPLLDVPFYPPDKHKVFKHVTCDTGITAFVYMYFGYK